MWPLSNNFGHLLLLFMYGVVRDTVLIVLAIVVMTSIFVISFVVYVYR